MLKTLFVEVRKDIALTPRFGLCLACRFEKWKEEFNVQVVPTTAGFMDAWDGDDTLVYDPETTAALVLSK